MSIDTFHVRVTDYFDYNPEGIGLGKTFYSQDGDGRDGVRYKMVRYDSSVADIMKGDPIYHDEDGYASLSTGNLAIMGYAASNVPCSKLGTGEYYYAFIQAEGVCEVAIYDTTVAGAVTTYDNDLLARGPRARPDAADKSQLTGTVAIESDDGVVTGTGTLFTSQLKVGDTVFIDNTVAAGVDHVARVISIASATSMVIMPRPAADVAATATIYKIADGSLRALGDTYRSTVEKVLEETATGTAGAASVTMSATVAEKLKAGDIISAVNANGDVEYQCVASVSTVTITTAANLAYNWAAGTVVTARSMLIKALVK